MRGLSPAAADRFRRYVLPGLAFKAVVIGGGYATGRELAEFFLPAGAWGGVLAMALATLIWGDAPGWFEAALAGSGLGCVALVVGAFLSIHRRMLPWALLAAAAVPLAGSVLLTSTVG